MKRRISAIYLLCLMTVIGILALQYIYITHLYAINREQIRKEINLALETTAKQYMASDFNDHVKVDYSGDNITLLGLEKNEDRIPFIDSIIQSMDRNEPIGSNINLKIESPEGNESNAHDAIPNNIKIDIKDLLYVIIDNEISNSNTTNIHRLDSIFSAELSKRNIDYDYYLDIIKQPDGNIIESTAKKDADTTSSLYSDPYAISIIKTKDVRAKIAKPHEIILKKLSWALLGAIGLTIILIASFLLMLSTIFKQKQLSQIRSDFINNMTHELKTPIATVSAAVESMQNFGVLDDRAKTDLYLNISKKELNRLSGLVEKVLSMAREERKPIQLNFETIDLRALCNNLINSQQIKDIKKKVDIKLDIPANAASVNADYVHFSNVIHNLVENSIKYSKEEVTINISTKVADDFFEININDNGKGIAKKHLSKIFDQFYRVPTGDVHNVKGFGLGLYYVYKIIQRHGGSIHAKSTLGKGTSFTIKLPN